MKCIKYSVLLIGTVLMCLSNGYTQSGWYSQTSGVTSDLFGVWFTDDSTGFAVGGLPGNCILHTTDAGTTWNPQTYPEITDYLATVRFSDSMNGWVSGGVGIILKTLDGGATWDLQSSGTSENLETIFCISNDTAWAGGAFGTILYTTDGGDNWNSQVSGISSHIFEFYFFDADTGIAVGGTCDGCIPVDTLGGYILRTTNGGTDWSIQKLDTTTVGLYGVSFADVNTGTAVGAGGSILHTTDGGETWFGQTSGTTVELWDVFFINVDTGFVVGGNWFANQGGIILRTENGGTTWTEQNIDTEMPLNRVFFTNDTIGTAVGNDGTILRTETGGLTWIREKSLDGMTRNSSISESYPNPFYLETNIKFQIQGINNVILKIYTVHGQEVATLVNEEMVPGIYEVTWDASSFPGGVYFYRLEVGTYVESRKLVLIR